MCVCVCVYNILIFLALGKVLDEINACSFVRFNRCSTAKSVKEMRATQQLQIFIYFLCSMTFKREEVRFRAKFTFVVILKIL